MNKHWISLTALFFSMCVPCSDAWAQQPPSAASAAPKATAQPAKHNALSIPLKFAGIFTGFVCGTPVAFVKKFPQEVNEGAHGIVSSIAGDECNSKLMLVPAALIWAPFALFVTGVEAPGYAIRNACWSEHFSKESFSLEALDSPSAK
jgi:hypothetical protein